MQYFEDLVIGAKSSFGSYKVTREEVIEFAKKFDPQAFHLDDEAAAKTHFGKVAASGWHTGAMTMHMMVANMQANEQAMLGSPGMDELRWLKPVYPGDTLRVENETLSKQQSKSKPEIGNCITRINTFNQHDEVVMTFLAIGIIRLRGD